MGILVGIFLIIIFILVAILDSTHTINEKVKEVREIKTEVIQGKNGVELIKLVDDEANKLLVEIKTLYKLRKLKEIDIEVTPTGIIKIEDEKIRKLLIKKISVIIRNLKLVYDNSNWNNKRFLYDIISDLETLKDSLKENILIEADMNRVNTIISVLKIDSNYKRIYENIIFEWEKNYI